MSKLLILGNGFDMHCKLETSYLHFFKYLQEKEKFKDAYDLLFEKDFSTRSILNVKMSKVRINIWWALLLSYHNEKQVFLWKDIENIMITFLLSEPTKDYPFNDNTINLNDIKKNISKYLETLKKDYTEGSIAEMNAKPIFIFLWLLYRTGTYGEIMNFDYNVYQRISKPSIKTIEEIIPILKNDLTEIETEFGIYLKLKFEKLNDNQDNEKVIKANQTYMQLLGLNVVSNPISTEFQNTLTFLFQKANVLSFNYTRVGLPYIQNFSHFKNVHGTVMNGDNSEIIFGIDSIDISPDDPIYIFTKTFRVSLLENYLNNSPNIKKNTISLKDIEEIIIYGHSLNKQDYSYFYAIFNRANISAGGAIVTLCYSNYDNSNKAQENSLILQQLIYNYELNANIPKGLYHRMLIEGRIGLREIPN